MQSSEEMLLREGHRGSISGLCQFGFRECADSDCALLFGSIVAGGFSAQFSL